AGVAVPAEGPRAAFPACGDDGCRLFARRLESLATEAVPGADGGAAPFLSRDGSRIGYFANGSLKVTSSDGATASLADARQAMGGTWLDESTMVFAGSLAGPLMRVSANGGGVGAVASLRLQDGQLAQL